MCVTYGGNNIAVFVDIALSYNDKILIKNLHLAKEYNARKSRSLLVDFLLKRWTKRSISRLHNF